MNDACYACMYCLFLIHWASANCISCQGNAHANRSFPVLPDYIPTSALSCGELSMTTKVLFRLLLM